MIRKAPLRFRQYLWLAVVSAISLACVPAYLHAYVINSTGVSEVPTILPGDTILANQAAYELRLPYTNVKLFRTGSPRRGEMVVINVPTSHKPAPKRVIGVPGDTIEIKESRVIVNGLTLPISALKRADFTWVPDVAKMGATVEAEDGHWISYTPEKSDYRNYPALHLAEGQYFVIGDNRDESADSRLWGPLPENLIIGKVVRILRTGTRR